MMVLSWLLPGFSVNGFIGAIIAAVVIAVLGYVAERLLGKRISPYGRGIVGFIAAAVVIYLAQYLIPSYLQVSIIGALLAALIIGIVDAFVPTALR